MTGLNSRAQCAKESEKSPTAMIFTGPRETVSSVTSTTTSLAIQTALSQTLGTTIASSAMMNAGLAQETTLSNAFLATALTTPSTIEEQSALKPAGMESS